MKKKYSILGALTLFVIVFDQLTKYLVMQRFGLHESMPIIPGFFDLTYVRNTGAAFGFMATAHPSFRVPFFLVVPVVALVAIAYIFRRIPETDWKLSIALSLVVGGAVGNLIDRVFLGYVVDFLDFYWGPQHFPAFNVADTAICIGVGVLTLDLLTQDKKDKSSDAPSPT